MMMKLAATYVVFDDGDRVERIESSEEYDIDFDKDLTTSLIQSVVDDLENSLGVCVDQGGDDHFYEFDFPDGASLDEESEVRELAEELLASVGKILRENGR